MRELPAPAWEQVKVADVIERHFCGPSPDCEERPVFDDVEWGVLKTTAITWSGWNQNAHKVLPRSYWGREGIEVKAGDVLVTKAGPRHRVAVVTHVPETRRQLVVSGKMIGLRPRADLVLPEVLAGLLALREPQKYIHDRTTGMAESQVNFANDVLLEAPLRLPPRAEQTEIARIAGTLDATIRQTEAIIEKLKQVKQGLLHDLLTRGIDANGELRPPQSQAPHLYKNSPLGWIPKEWEAIRMAEAIRELGQGWSPDCPPEPAEADRWGVLKTTAIVWDGYADHENKALPVTLRPRPDLEVVPEDILITRAGPKERVAVVAHVESTRPGLMISDKMYRLRLRDADVPAYFALALSSQYAQSAVTRTISGMADSQTNISQPIIRLLQVMRPPTDEQRAIALRVAALAGRLRAEHWQLLALGSLKLGLMDDLLTGRVRVTSLLA